MEANVERDRKCVKQLLSEGWRVATVWECSIRKALKLHDKAIFDKLASWLKDEKSVFIEL